MAKKKVEAVKYPKEIFVYKHPGDNEYLYASAEVSGVVEAGETPQLIGIYELKEVATFVGKFERVD